MLKNLSYVALDIWIFKNQIKPSPQSFSLKKYLCSFLYIVKSHMLDT